MRKTTSLVVAMTTTTSWLWMMVYLMTGVQFVLQVQSLQSRSSFFVTPPRGGPSSFPLVVQSFRPTTTTTTTTNTGLYSTVSPFTSSSTSSSSSIVGPRISINENYQGLKRISTNPDIFIIENFLSSKSCQDIMNRAIEKGTLTQSPVAYAGWTQDFQDLTELAIKGPVSWISLITAWFQVKDSSTMSSEGSITTNPTISLVLHALQNFSILFVVTVLAIGAYTKSRGDGLQQLRTSTSTTLDDLSDLTSGTTEFVQRTAELFCSTSSSSRDISEDDLQKEAALFEAPTVIRYEPGQVLAPHFDANRSADTEDANRGGQTLATLLVYLNDVPNGGLTRFGKLPKATTTPTTVQQEEEEDNENENDDPYLTIQPKLGDALLFFPADAAGNFDERTEHEGCPAIDEKWIARIWRHSRRVPPPFGLTEEALSQISSSSTTTSSK